MKAGVVCLTIACGGGSTPRPSSTDAGIEGTDASAASPDARVDGGLDAGRSDAGTIVDAGTRADAGSLPPLTGDEVAALRARPYRLVVPPSYDGGAAVPMLVLLHGYTDSAQGVDSWFHMTQLAQARGFVLALPEGTLDGAALRFWNATDACCDFYGSGVDDVGYLTAVLDDVRLRVRIDARRVFVMGHSNGAFMALRLACERSDRIAGVVALAGANWNEPARCQPTTPLAVLQVHGNSDSVIDYDGGENFGVEYPSAHATLDQWAAHWGCTGAVSGGEALDLVTTLPGKETSRLVATGCVGGVAELWTMAGADHIPQFTASWPGVAYDFLLAHPKP